MKFYYRPGALVFAAGILLFAAIRFSAIVYASSPSLQSITFSGTLVLPDGKPAADAVITVDVMDQNSRQVVSSTQITPNQKGFYSGGVQLDLSRQETPILFASTKTDFAPLSINYPGHQTVLEPATTVHFRLVDGDGKAIPNMRLAPAFFIPLNGTALIPAAWSEGVDSRWTVKTDPSGYATITDLPQSYSLILHIDSDNYIEPNLNDAGMQLGAGSITPDQTVKVMVGGSVTGIVFYGPTGQPAAGVTVIGASLGNGTNAEETVTTDSNGRYQLNQLSPGSYYIEYDDSSDSENGWTTVAKSAILKSGDQLSHVDLRLTHGALVFGVVRDKITGNPLGQILVRSSGSDHPEKYNTENIAITDSQGKYALRVSPGNQVVIAASADDPHGSKQVVAVDEGDQKKLNFFLTLPGSPILASGTVFEPDGKPASGAKVSAFGASFPISTYTDSSGRFTFSPPGIPPTALLYASKGNLITSMAVPANAEHDMTLHLARRGGISIAGTVTDGNGIPVAGAIVELFRENGDGSGFGIDSVKADKRGKYLFPAEFGHGEYEVRATHDGYTVSTKDTLIAAPGKNIHLSPFVIEIADSFVGGKLVDANGVPVAGAIIDVNQVMNLMTQTDSTGEFFLKGVPNNVVSLHITTPSGRQVVFSTRSGANNIVLKLN